MGRPKRKFLKKSYYHIYNRGNNKERIFRTNSDKNFFIRLLYQYRNETDLILDTLTVMDNHFHLLIRTGNHPEVVSTFMRKVCTAYAVVTNRKYGRVGHLFQGRFESRFLKYKKDVENVRNYIKQNPVKEGCVKKAKDYPWSRFD